MTSRIGLGDVIAAGNDFAHLDTGQPLGDLAERIVTANAYIGCWGIVEALNQGADIVITGRATDAAVVAGPAAWHHGWARDDWDALAGAIVAGHVIECGGQVTGGNYSFFTEIADMTYPGFPWAEVAADGSSVIGKHSGTGGEVSIGTVTSQLLYEIQSERYMNPDVVSRFDSIDLNQTGPDRVRISGVRGEPAPPTLKVAMNYQGGYRNQISIGLTGLDIEAKAELIERQFWHACPVRPRGLRDGGAQVPADAQGRPSHERGSSRRLQDHREGPRRAQGRPSVLQCGHRDRTVLDSRHVRHRWRAGTGTALRRLLARPG